LKYRRAQSDRTRAQDVTRPDEWWWRHRHGDGRWIDLAGSGPWPSRILRCNRASRFQWGWRVVVENLGVKELCRRKWPERAVNHRPRHGTRV